MTDKWFSVAPFQHSAPQGAILCSVEQLSPLSSISLSVFYLQSPLINRNLFTCTLNILTPISSIFKRKHSSIRGLCFYWVKQRSSSLFCNDFCAYFGPNFFCKFVLQFLCGCCFCEENLDSSHKRYKIIFRFQSWALLSQNWHTYDCGCCWSDFFGESGSCGRDHGLT